VKFVSLTIPYLYLLHVLIISLRWERHYSSLRFGAPGLPQYLRVILVFSIAVGVSVIAPFNAEVYAHPGLVLPWNS
jgi:hypothetical protein